MVSSMTTLEYVSNALGWQGGTINAAKEAFDALPLARKDSVASGLAHDIRLISDPRTALEFVVARNQSVGI